MRLRKLAYVLVAALVLGLLAGCGGNTVSNQEAEVPSDYADLMKYLKGQATEESLSCWYTSEDDKAWLETAASDFEKEYGVQVNLVYYDGVNLFEDLNQANQKGEGPEVYLAGNDQLELAVLGGMTEENHLLSDDFWQDTYPETAKSAVTYKEKQYGYPVYFDTYCLVYDANLLENAPASIDDILTFADEYEDTGSTKAIFRWDVADPYINTMFLAAYANLFGENGDDSTAFQINDDNCVAAMEYFQSLSAYLWMNKNNISHDTIMNRIEEGTLVLGLCKSDILPVLYDLQKDKTIDESGEETSDQEEVATEDETEQEEAAQETEDTASEGETQDVTDYQVSYVPSLTSELSSKTLSTTYAAFINPYGNDSALGNLFALYLSVGQADKQYAGNGRLPVVNQKDGFDSMQSIIYAQYQNSQPVPKVAVLGDYLSEGGIAFDAIWEGEDAKEQLDWLQTVMEEKLQ
jgi:hypothetical protein